MHVFTLVLATATAVLPIDGAEVGAKLPFVVTDGQDNTKVSELKKEVKWWARVEDHVFYSPPSLLGLSQNITDYYYTLGSKSALTDEMKKHYVGGEGRVHILHLPKGPSMLQTMQVFGNRRASFSVLNRLKAGSVLSGKTFPKYSVDESYTNPLRASDVVLEKKAVESLTMEQLKYYLTEVTDLKVGSLPTRSYSNPEASKEAQRFMNTSFSSMGLPTCLHTFEYNGKPMVNVIGYIEGAAGNRDSITLGAHYDSRPFDGSAPGAEDNGSGVAALLAIARAYQQAKVAPTKHIYFVGFAGEEAGLLGSDQFARELQSSGKGIPKQCRISPSFLQVLPRRHKTNHAIILDEVGWLSKNLPKPTVNLESYDNSGTKLVMQNLVAASMDHNGNAMDVVHSGNPFGSDHMSWLTRDMPAVLTINGDDEAYPFYHQSSDTIENVNVNYATMIAKMNLGALMRLAGLRT